MQESREFIIDDKLKISSYKYSKVSTGMPQNGIYERSKFTIDVQTGQINGLLSATHEAFSKHLPLILTPDIILITIMQSLGVCIAQDPKSFYDISSKYDITMRDDSLNLTPESIPVWSKAFQTFNSMIQSKFNQNFPSCNFTTSTSTSIAVSHIVVMDIMQPFAKYTAMSYCGIPSIILKGTLEDWLKLQSYGKDLLDMYSEQLGWWLNDLQDFLKSFVDLYQGTLNDVTKFQSFYKFESHSGGDTVTGDILNLFPYVLKINSKEYNRRIDEKYTIIFEQIPTLLSNVPITFKTAFTTTELEVVAGVIDVIQDETSSGLEAVPFWSLAKK